MEAEKLCEYPFFPGVNLRFRFMNDDVQADLKGPLAPIVKIFIGKSFTDHFKLYKRINTLAEREGQRVYTLYYPPFPSKAYVKFLKTVSKWAWKQLPKAATIAVTYACQCECLHCSAGLYLNPANKELSTEEMKDTIDQCLKLGATNITFTGGEPLLRPDIYDLIAHVDRDEAVTQLFTNGLLLSKENIKKLKEAGLYSLEVSLDSPDPEEHDRFRGIKGCFEKAVAGIKTALEEGLLVGISTYVTKESLRNGKFEELIRFGRDLGVHEVSIFDTVPTGKYINAEELMLSDEERRVVIQIQFRFNKETQGGFRVSTQAFQTSPLAYIPFGCFAGTNQVYVTAYGDVTPCDFTPIAFGNVRVEPLKQIWDRIRKHPAYRNRSMRCRIQCMDFRERYIHKVPNTELLPCSVNLLPQEEHPSAIAKAQNWFYSFKASLSINRLRILDSLPARSIMHFIVPTKAEVIEMLRMDPDKFEKDLGILIKAGLVRTEPYDGEIYLFTCRGGLIGLFRRFFTRYFLRLISNSPPTRPASAKKWMDWVEEKEIFW